MWLEYILNRLRNEELKVKLWDKGNLIKMGKSRRKRVKCRSKIQSELDYREENEEGKNRKKDNG